MKKLYHKKTKQYLFNGKEFKTHDLMSKYINEALGLPEYTIGQVEFAVGLGIEFHEGNTVTNFE